MAGEGRSRPYVVVVGVDYSELGAEALDRAFELVSGRDGAELHAVNVVRNFGEFVMLESARPSVYGVSLQEASSRLSDYVDAARRRFEERQGHPLRLRCMTHLRAEIPADEIVALASDVGADVIVVGTHGRRGMRRWVLGSVAESVVRLADCAVLVVRQRGNLDVADAAGESRSAEPPKGESARSPGSARESVRGRDQAGR